MSSTHEAHLHEPLEWDTPLFRTAVAQFDQAVPYADIHPDIAERLRYPERAVLVSCPVRMDDGTRRVFPGYRVQHSSVLGPTKGGVRYDPEVNMARLLGANKKYIEQTIPHIGSLMQTDCADVVKHAEVLIVGLAGGEIQSTIIQNIREDQVVLDLVGLDRGEIKAADYYGVCW